MGIRVHPIWPPVPGPDCPVCSPLPWPEGATPTTIRVIFRGLKTCDALPDPPNGLPIALVNSETYPCWWSSELFYGAETYTVAYNAAGAELYMYINGFPPIHIFDAFCDPCSIGPFTNIALCPDHSEIGGTGVILDMPLSIIVLLTETYNIQPDQDALYDIVDSATPDYLCVRLTGRTSPGSVLVHVDTGAIP